MMMRILPSYEANFSERLCQHLRWIFRGVFCGSLRETDTQKVLKAFVEGLTDAVCYAA